ncbi:MAG: hypothetical protein QXD13_02290, partial [Candidatus Pacearchaeota archaeon]
LTGKIDIKNNIMVTDVSETDLNLGKAKQKGIKFTFDFTAEYEPKIGSINFVGEILYLEDAKKIEEIMKEWKKSQKAPEDVSIQIVRAIISKCYTKSLIWSEEVNLPPPIPIPTLNLDTPKQQEKKK